MTNNRLIKPQSNDNIQNIKFVTMEKKHTKWQISNNGKRNDKLIKWNSSSAILSPKRGKKKVPL